MLRSAAARKIAIRYILGSKWKSYDTSIPSTLKSGDLIENPEQWFKALHAYFKGIAKVKGKSGGATIKSVNKHVTDADLYYDGRFSVHPELPQYKIRMGIYHPHSSRGWGWFLVLESPRNQVVFQNLGEAATLDRIYKHFLNEYQSFPKYVWLQTIRAKLHNVIGVAFTENLYSYEERVRGSWSSSGSDGPKVIVRAQLDEGAAESWEMEWRDQGTSKSSDYKANTLEDLLDQVPTESDSDLIWFADPTKLRDLVGKIKKILGVKSINLPDSSLAASQGVGHIFAADFSKSVKVTDEKGKGRYLYVRVEIDFDASTDKWSLACKFEVPFIPMYEGSTVEISSSGDRYKISAKEVVDFYKSKIPYLSKFDVQVSRMDAMLHLETADESIPDVDSVLDSLTKMMKTCAQVTDQQVGVQIDDL